MFLSCPARAFFMSKVNQDGLFNQGKYNRENGFQAESRSLCGKMIGLSDCAIFILHDQH